MNWLNTADGQWINLDNVKIIIYERDVFMLRLPDELLIHVRKTQHPVAYKKLQQILDPEKLAISTAPMIRVSVSLPQELKNSMDELPEVNWSCIARRAFLQEINTQSV